MTKKAYPKYKRVKPKRKIEKPSNSIPFESSVASRKCNSCGGWINPPWKRGDGDYRHCECKTDKS